MPQLRFSIVVTCYNQRTFIQEAVDSAVLQRHPSKEVIVVDDGSTDGSADVLRQYPPSIRLVVLPSNSGAVEARNHGAGLAKGEYLVFLDGDDALLPWALDVYERLIEERAPKIIAGQTAWFSGAAPPSTDTEWPAGVAFVDYDAFLLKDRPYGMCASSLVVHKEAFSAVGGWSPGIFQLDLQDLITKLGYAGRALLICKPPTALYRIHQANTIHIVPPFLQSLKRLLAKERAGEYSGGGLRCFERRAWFGGLVVFWVKRGVLAGFYQEAWGIASSALSMIVAAIIRRASLWVSGRRPVETLEVPAQPVQASCGASHSGHPTVS